MTEQGGDKIGFGSPPKSKQFAPGQSGNPAGRPKSASFKSDLLRELGAPIQLRDETGSLVTVTKQQALVKMLIAAALQNEKSAISGLLALMRFCNVGSEEESSRTLQADDLALMRAFVARAEASEKQSKGNSSPNQSKE